MSIQTETATTIGKAVILGLHHRNENECEDDAQYIPMLKTVINGVVSTMADPLSQRQVQQALYEYARELYMQAWIASGDEDDPAIDEGLETFDSIYEQEMMPE
ncbi:hypothetical protein [Endozoicomonas sp. SCSIO W0465]|uniref:hypothetical protein n=1 Tax=Endozoicomonas sp. SCSIO W0465 TaxID=2918516 RepID=UPI0020753F25|nr:hypothetical protein [Endozoicomonas sp. SCSIO W0465]USE36579.1 hypothetical protein MJO57_31990 [Endozoicomonas sp. SCSIO W0465]